MADRRARGSCCHPVVRVLGSRRPGAPIPCYSPHFTVPAQASSLDPLQRPLLTKPVVPDEENIFSNTHLRLGAGWADTLGLPHLKVQVSESVGHAVGLGVLLVLSV